MVLGTLLGAVSVAHAAEPDAPPESADASTPVVVLPVELEGELPDGRREELRSALEAGLRRGGFSVVEPPSELGACQTQPCRVQVARGVGAEYAVAMRVSVERRDYAIALEVIDAEADASVALSEERCDVCGFAEAVEVVDSQAAAIVARLDALALEPPVVVFQSVPPGAVIQVDGEIVGKAPFERVVEPGPHVVRAELEEHVSEQREIEAVPGVRAAVRFELEPVPDGRDGRWLRPLGWTSLGIGIAAVGSGIPLILIDGRPNVVSCSGENVDPLGNCKFLYATLEAGIAVTVVGGALVATGIGLLVASRKRRRRSSATAAVGIGPRGVVLRGRF